MRQMVIDNKNKVLSFEIGMLKEFFDKLPDPAILTDDYGRIMLANKLANEFLHQLQDGLNAIIGFVLNNKNEFLLSLGIITEILKNGKAEWQVEINGSVIYIVADKYKIADKVRFIVFFRLNDFSLGKIEKRKLFDVSTTSFLANISHELRTPLNSIIGFAELMIKKNISIEKQREFISIIYNNGNYLVNLISDLIDLSKIESGKIELVKSQFSINRLLYELQLFFLMDLKNKNKDDILLTMSPGLADGTDMIYADERRIKQVVINLLSNSIKFTSHGEISFGYKLISGSMIEFYFRDTGIGIDEKAVKYVFERFKQANDSINTNFGGSGLGLSISKDFIEMHGGRMWAESIIGNGSVFYFTLPIR
jgi:signal transduction histidine kinase